MMRPMALTRKVLLAATLVVLMGSCGQDGIFGRGNQVCTLIGCDSGVTVRLASQPAGAIKIEVFYQGPGSSEPAFVYDCAENCLQQVTFRGFTPDHPYVRITYGGLTRGTAVSNVSYTVSRPNGEDCEPECKQGTIDLPLPSPASLREARSDG